MFNARHETYKKFERYSYVFENILVTVIIKNGSYPFYINIYIYIIIYGIISKFIICSII